MLFEYDCWVSTYVCERVRQINFWPIIWPSGLASVILLGLYTSHLSPPNLGVPDSLMLSLVLEYETQ